MTDHQVCPNCKNGKHILCYKQVRGFRCACDTCEQIKWDAQEDKLQAWREREGIEDEPDE